MFIFLFMSMNEEKGIISLSGLLIAFLVALSAFLFSFILQCPGVHLNLISLFDLERRLLIKEPMYKLVFWIAD